MTFGDAPSRARRILRTGDTILSTVRTYLKAILFIDDALDGFICTTGFAVMSPIDDVHPRYLGYVLRSPDITNCVTSLSVGIAYPAISESVLGRIRLAIPPTKQEQAAIVAMIETELASLNRMADSTNREILFFRQFHARLVSEVATGKLDVRAATAALPETTESEPVDEAIDEEDVTEAVDDIKNEAVAA
jgi:type I restriction enzyme, S subunit